MKEEIILELKETAAHIWKDHRCKAVGLFLGCVAGISVLIFGFFSTLFVLLCGSLGLYLGICFDRGDSAMDILNRVVPKNFQRW